MITHRRYLCATCDREWLPNASAAGADPWTPEMGCPGCRSSKIAVVDYQPSFLGGDIPRASFAAQLQAAAAPIVAEEDRNWALELSAVRS